jgi:hypothetical protein
LSSPEIIIVDHVFIALAVSADDRWRIK